jgi:tetratricopeptide (TPR) repeat protein
MNAERFLYGGQMVQLTQISYWGDQTAASPPADHHIQEGQTHWCWGMQHFNQAHFSKALQSFQAALREFMAAQHIVSIGKSLNALSAVYLMQQQYGRSQAYSQAAVSILAPTAARNDYAIALQQLGLSYFKQGDWAIAQSYLERAIAVWRKLGDHWGEDITLVWLGQVYGQRREFMYALACYEAVLERLLGLPCGGWTDQFLGTLLELVMQLCKAMGRPKQAIAPIFAVLNQVVWLQDVRRIELVWRRLGQLYETQQHYVMALECYYQALRVMPPQPIPTASDG